MICSIELRFLSLSFNKRKKSKSQQMPKNEKYYKVRDNISQQTPNNYAKYGARSK